MATTGLRPISVAAAGPIMAAAAAKSWSADRREVIDDLNRYREMLYTDYDKLQLFDNIFYVLPINTYVECGLDPCGATEYQGFSVPNDIAGVEAIYQYGVPLTLHSRWRETHTGVGVATLPRADATQMAETFATQRDLNKVSKVGLFTEHEDDHGKCAFIEVLDFNNRRKKIKFELVYNAFVKSPCRIRKVISVVLPTDLMGSIRLSQTDGYDLSIYDPWENVPSYRRYRLASSRCTSSVLVHGNKRFQNVYFDNDIVEVGNRLIIEAAGRYLRYSTNGVDPKEIKRALFDKSEMDRYLLGEQAREDAGAVEDGSPFKGRPITASKTLPGYY